MNIREALRSLGHMRFLRFGVRDRVIRRFHHPDRCDSELFSVPFFGARYSGDFSTFVDWSVYYYGAYALEELRLMGDFLGAMEDPVVLDIGSNVGNHTLFAALHAKEVFAFEPHDAVADQLDRKIAENCLTNVTVLRFGLGESDGSVEHPLPAGHGIGTGRFAQSSPGGQSLPMSIRRGDSVVADLQLPRVHFVKIDSEGNEPFVLRGLKHTLHRDRPLVFFEWTQGERKLGTSCEPSLLPRGYRFYQFVGDTVVMGVFRKPAYELQLLRDFWPHGSLLAAPQEYIARLRRERPTLDVVKRLIDR